MLLIILNILIGYLLISSFVVLILQLNNMFSKFGIFTCLTITGILFTVFYYTGRLIT
jgi:hypothetical protein